MKFTPIALIATSALVTGCATVSEGVDSSTAGAAETQQPNYSYVPNAHFAQIANAQDERQRDRLAILAMQGDYRVDFHFQETVALAAGYEHRDDKNTGGYETVHVVEEKPGHIVLQHLLVSTGGHVIKHWRQDWTYEAAERFEFVADQTWEVVALDPAKTAGTWTQCVFEVSDAPRYCGTGTWNHRYGVSTWTSDRTWRPLPRREYTKREDYNAINAENRHTITPNGWTHEQDNTKTLRDGRATQQTLVREFGFNDYRNIEGFDFGPATAYWKRTGDYWARVRAAWDKRLAGGQTLTLKTQVDGMPIITGTFGHASEADSTSADDQLDAIEALLNEWTAVEGSERVSALR